MQSCWVLTGLCVVSIRCWQIVLSTCFGIDTVVSSIDELASSTRVLVAA